MRVTRTTSFVILRPRRAKNMVIVHCEGYFIIIHFLIDLLIQIMRKMKP